MQIAENVQADWQEGCCFIMTMPDPIQPEQPRREFRNCSGDFLSIRLSARTWASSDFHLFRRLKHYFDDICFAEDEEVETEVQKWLKQQSKTSMLRVSTKCIDVSGGHVEE
jgi:hypothetical protein